MQQRSQSVMPQGHACKGVVWGLLFGSDMSSLNIIGTIYPVVPAMHEGVVVNAHYTKRRMLWLRTLGRRTLVGVSKHALPSWSARSTRTNITWQTSPGLRSFREKCGRRPTTPL